MNSKSIDIKKLNNIYNKERKERYASRPRKDITLKQLQLSFLNSLARSPVINLKKRRKELEFDDYFQN